MGFLDLNLDLDWGEKGGQCYECWKCSPMCGNECNFNDCLYCWCCWQWCFLCNASKLFSSGLGAPKCLFINHFGVYCVFSVIPILNCFIWTMNRLSYRRKFTIGANDCNCCDCFCSSCCFTIPCTYCQECRTGTNDRWDWLDQYARDLTFHKLIKGEFDVFYQDVITVVRDENSPADVEPDPNPYANVPAEELQSLRENAPTFETIFMILGIVFIVLACISPFSPILFLICAILCLVFGLICCGIGGALFIFIVGVICLLIGLILLVLFVFFFFLTGVSFFFFYALPVLVGCVSAIMFMFCLYFRRINHYLASAA